jgi:hypothetical protein
LFWANVLNTGAKIEPTTSPAAVEVLAIGTPSGAEEKVLLYKI